MRTPRPRTRLALLAALSLFPAAVLTAAAPAVSAAPAPASAGRAAAAPFKVLVFSKTTGYRHDSIPAGIAAIQQLGCELGHVAGDVHQLAAACLPLAKIRDAFGADGEFDEMHGHNGVAFRR